MEADDLYLDAIAHTEAERWAEAEQALQGLTEHEPESQRVAVLRAVLWEKQGQTEAALGHLEAFLARAADNAVARTNLARLQWKAGQRNQALGSLRLGLAQDPNQERPLHFYAALLEEDLGLAAALEALQGLARGPGAWLPAWVAALLASQRGAPEAAGRLLVLAAEQAQVPFPPNPLSFSHLLESLPAAEQRRVAVAVRPFCRAEAQAVVDRILLTAPRSPLVETKARVTPVRRSVWRHLSQPSGRSILGLGPICLIKPESWDVEEVMGRLGRGMALLMAEALDSLGCSATVLLESVPGSGLLTRHSPPSGEMLAAQAVLSCTHLASVYLSFRAPGEFILDAELYDARGVYLARESSRATHPGACLDEMSRKFVARFGTESSAGYPPLPELEIEDAMARDAVAALVLCAEGALSAGDLGNPGLALDNLVDYAFARESAAALLTLWAGVEAGARAGLPGAVAQKEVMAEIVAENSWMRDWLGP